MYVTRLAFYYIAQDPLPREWYHPQWAGQDSPP